MAGEDKTVSGMAGRYALALFELANEAGQLDQVQAYLARFSALIAGSEDLRRLVKSPVFSSEDQAKAVGAILDKAGIGGTAGNYIKEAHLMVMEGVPTVMIDNLAKQAGMPVGPLTLNDEVAIDLGLKILKATKAQVGTQAVDPQQEKLLTFMVEQEGRVGKKAKKGFYDYPDTGKKTAWQGIKALVGTMQDPDTIDRQEIIDRLLVTTALEASRCVEEGVVTDPREADVGSILGFGFAPWSGGTLSYIDMIGTKAFVKKCDALAAKYGDRFTPNPLLREMAQTGETFYGRMAGKKAAA